MDGVARTIGGLPSETGPLVGLIDEAMAVLGVRAGAWRRAGSGDRWITVAHHEARIPEQGWKLHVSATVPGALTTLKAVLPVLLDRPTAFKVAASLEALTMLNSGTGALSQVGKFITVYPSDDADAVDLARRLDQATVGLAGPVVPSDRRLREGSAVYYRYGAFGSQLTQSKNGEIAFAVRAPDGALYPDLRNIGRKPPSWVVDPFRASAEFGAPPEISPLVAGRYLVAGALHRSARGGVYLAADLETGQRLVLKRAQAHALMLGPGGDARDRLRHEAGVMRRLAGDDRIRCPRVHALVEQDDDLYLVMDDVDARPLERVVRAWTVTGRLVPRQQVVAVGRALARMLGAIHEQDLVYRDLKSTNVLLRADDEPWLIDFEHACQAGVARVSGGTRGYMSPQQAAGVPAHATDDVYALGALLLFLATGAEPSQAPRPDRPLDRPLELLNPDLDPALARVISRCLVPDRASRFQQASDVDSALAAMQAGSPTLRARRRDDAAPDTGVDAPGYRQLSQALGDSICAAALGDPDSEGLTWVSDHPLAKGIGARDLNVGAAGTLLALAQLVDALDDPVHRDTLRRGANLLACSPTQAGLPLPGLFVGESGVAAALLRAGQVLGDAALVDAAVRASRNVSRQPYDSPDLFNGAAGRLLVHLLCWDETGEPVDLDAARAAGEHLLRTSQPTDDGFGIRWPIPPGFGGMSGQSYLGFAHGVAGIADVLVDLGEATGDDRFAAPVRAAVDTLERTASSCLDDDTGLSWPSTEGGETAAAFWCHGAAGIGTFLIDAGTTPKAAGLARGAMHATARGTRWSSPTRCHGLAGSAEALLDAYQRTGDVHLLKALREIGTLLAAYVTPSRLGLTAPSESTAVVTPDYNLGFAGVATTFLRLSDPDHRPRDLSRAGFRFRSTSVLVHEPQETSAL